METTINASKKRFKIKLKLNKKKLALKSPFHNLTAASFLKPCTN